MKKTLPLILAGLFCLTAFGQTAPPNILLILADDLGNADLSIQGCKEFETPNIDSIAKNGIRFTQGYVSNSVCAPSRAGMLSGRIDIGFEANIPGHPEPNIGLNANLKTMADMLKTAGYGTYCVGKWHLGEDEPFYPTNRGFDYFCGLRGGSRSYFPNKDSDSPKSSNRIEINGKDTKFEGYLTDYFTDKAVEQIESHTKTKPEKPFFMYLAYTAPHAPMDAKPEDLKKFSHIEKEKRRIYAAMVTAMDAGVGKVLGTLKEKDLLKNTMVVFLSDNGGPLWANGSSNGPLKGSKGTLWEGGVRVPFLIQWPGKIAANQVRSDVVSSLDLMPTFAAMAGTIPADKATGINLLPYLESKTSQVGDRKLYWRRGNMQVLGLRSGDFKMVANLKQKSWSFYDLTKDVGEKNDLATSMPEMAEQMKKDYKHWASSIPDQAFSDNWDEKNKPSKIANGWNMRKANDLPYENHPPLTLSLCVFSRQYISRIRSTVA